MADCCSDCRSKSRVHCMHCRLTWVHSGCCSCFNSRGVRCHARIVWISRLLLPRCGTDHRRRVLSSSTAWESEWILSCRYRRWASTRCVQYRTRIYCCSANTKTGPLVAGIMVQYTSWRNLLWLQVAMIGLSLVLALFFVPPSRLDKPGLTLNIRGWHAVAQFNPLPTFKKMLYPNIAFTVCRPRDFHRCRINTNGNFEASELRLSELDTIFTSRSAPTCAKHPLRSDVFADDWALLHRARYGILAWYGDRWLVFR